MSTESKYTVSGPFKGTKFKRDVLAYSSKQAKLKAGLFEGISGALLSSFMKSSKIKVRRTKI